MIFKIFLGMEKKIEGTVLYVFKDSFRIKTNFWKYFNIILESGRT